MLISQEDVIKVLNHYNIKLTGVLHIGAHDCEEKGFYNNVNISDSNIYWLDALEEKVQNNTNRGIPNCYFAVVSDKDDDEVEFFRTNNNQSSSILPLDRHKVFYPGINVVETRKLKTVTIDTFVKRNSIPIERCNFWNFDIQGAELLALKGAKESLQHAKVLYLEVNEEHLYKDCGLVREIDEYLNTYGFKRVMTIMTGARWGDAIYVKL